MTHNYILNTSVTDASFSVSQAFTISDNGDLLVDLPQMSLTLKQENIKIDFSETDAFISYFSNLVDQTKNFLWKNTNDILYQNKPTLDRAFSELMQALTEFNITFENTIIMIKFSQTDPIKNAQV